MSETPLNAPALLRRYGLQPDKSLGQNFLVDPGALAGIVRAAEIGPEETVLEVGPGLGGLTTLLAQEARQVIAVELDADLIPPLEEVCQESSNILVIQGDILGLGLDEILQTTEEDATPPYLVVANIPYYITSALIRLFLESEMPPTRLILTIQREVAERICAQSGKMSLLALSVQVYGKAYITRRIPAGAFYPPPKVDSAVIRVDRYEQPLIPPKLLPVFFRLAKAGFSQKRKTLRNSLSGGMHWSKTQANEFLEKAGIDPMRRAETLSLDEWGKLAKLQEI